MLSLPFAIPVPLRYSLVLPGVGVKCSAVQFTCPVFCQCSADGEDWMSKLMETKIGWKILCPKKYSHIN